MMQGRIFLGTRALGGVLLLAFFLFPHGEASAQVQSKTQQNCLNELNKNFSKVAKAQGGDINSCIKNAGKGKLGTQTIEQCIISDPKRKVEKATGKALNKGGPDGKCPESDPPDFGATDPNTANLRQRSRLGRDPHRRLGWRQVPGRAGEGRIQVSGHEAQGIQRLQEEQAQWEGAAPGDERSGTPGRVPGHGDGWDPGREG
jgi:hypothetical protein